VTSLTECLNKALPHPLLYTTRTKTTPQLKPLELNPIHLVFIFITSLFIFIIFNKDTLFMILNLFIYYYLNLLIIIFLNLNFGLKLNITYEFIC
jgi:hypothetical protein